MQTVSVRIKNGPGQSPMPGIFFVTSGDRPKAEEDSGPSLDGLPGAGTLSGVGSETP